MATKANRIRILRGVVGMTLLSLYLCVCSKGELKNTQKLGQELSSLAKVKIKDTSEVNPAEKTTSQIIKYDENGIHFQLYDSSWVSFINALGEYDGYQEHVFWGNLSDRLVLIHTTHYEGQSYTVLDFKSGKKIQVFTIPEISPDEKWFAEVGYEDIEIDAKPGFRIWEIGANSVDLSFNYSRVDASDITWLSADEISVCVKPPTSSDCIVEKIMLTDGKWINTSKSK